MENKSNTIAKYLNIINKVIKLSVKNSYHNHKAFAVTTLGSASPYLDRTLELTISYVRECP